MIAVGVALPLSGMFAAVSPVSDSFALQGRVDMVLYDESGNVKDERHIDNLIVDTGVEGVAYRIAPHDGTITPSSPYNYIALGTSDTAVDAADEELSAELAVGANYAREQDATAQYSVSSGNKLILSVVFGPGEGTGSLRESGMFNVATGGDMLARQTFTEIQKASGDTLTITWTITLTPV
ncbi:hypothetical protein [Candidatus Nitrososphaera sp. FF02]|uniref:hypothetical protein n=1 Tax=Candidatus Nitrososphaera sp. FF02 TaxID=3398226 RepID=UPI0039E856BD